MKIIFYTTLGCHLCEFVPPMLTVMKGRFDLHINVVDIADDDDLIAQYGQEIPVLYRPDINMDIAWPFDVSQLEQFFCLEE